MIDDIFSKNNMQDAFNSFSTKNNNAGKDGVLLKDAYEYYLMNRDLIISKVNKQKYKCGVIQLYEMLDFKGKQRMISRMCSIDRLISKAVAQVIEPIIDQELSAFNYAYRKNKGLVKAVDQIYAYVQKNSYVCFIDIKDFFENIDHVIMMKQIHNVINDPIVEALIHSFMNVEVEYDFKMFTKTIGLLQGNSLSPALSNLYLNDLDKHLEEKGVQFARYGDNIFMFFDDIQDAKAMLNHVNQLLEGRYKLKVNKNKTFVGNATEQVYLGYYINKKNDEFIISKNKRIKAEYFNSWHTSALSYSKNEYHIVDDGILRKKDYHLLFENESNKVDIPINATEHINVYSHIIFSTNFFTIMNEKKLVVNMFDKSNHFIGSFIPSSVKSGSSTLLNQVSAYNDEKCRLFLAQTFANCEIYNERANLKYYRKHLKDNEKINQVISSLTEALEKAKNCDDYNQLLLIEAQAKKEYYASINTFIENEDFQFSKRSRRPPQDYLNALISFGNVVLYNMIAEEIYKTSLDIRISYLHSSNSRKESLNLDVADVFKPIVIDRTIFMMINKKIITKEDFEHRDNGVFLNKEGKKKFLEQIRRKLNTSINYNGQSINYRSLIKRDINSILGYINERKKLKLYKYQ